MLSQLRNKGAIAQTERAEDASLGFDSYDLRLGDVLRGERATLSKSLEDVQSDLRIKIRYIEAIENCDLSAFESQGFIAGYVRSYARYLGLDPEETFEKFCRESGFARVHGAAMSAANAKAAKASLICTTDASNLSGLGAMAADASTTSRFDFIDLRAFGPVVVVAALIAGMGYGGWTLVQEIQRVTIVPVEQEPQLLAELDPLTTPFVHYTPDTGVGSSEFVAVDMAPEPDLFSLYSDTPEVLAAFTARDAPIATIRPGAVSALPLAAPAAPSTETPLAETLAVVARAEAPFELIAVDAAWVRLRDAESAVVFEGILEPGVAFAPEGDISVMTLHAGNSGSVYLRRGDEYFGPVGKGTSVVRGLSLQPEAIISSMAQLSALDLGFEEATAIAAATPASD